MAFTPVKKILPKVIKTAGIGGKIDESKVLENFNAAAAGVFGADILKKIKPISVENGVLTIACLSEIVAGRIKTAEKKLMWELNRPLGKTVIKKIKFLS